MKELKISAKVWAETLARAIFMGSWAMTFARCAHGSFNMGFGLSSAQPLPVGEDVTVELVQADPASRSVEFRLA